MKCVFSRPTTQSLGGIFDIWVGGGAGGEVITGPTYTPPPLIICHLGGGGGGEWPGEGGLLSSRFFFPQPSIVADK